MRQKASVARYIVKLANPVIGRDLAETLRDFDPCAEVLVVSCCAEALALTLERETISIAFIEADPADCAVTRLDAALACRGGRLVLLGDAAEEARGLRWPVLHRPFTSEIVHSLVFGCGRIA